MSWKGCVVPFQWVWRCISRRFNGCAMMREKHTYFQALQIGCIFHFTRDVVLAHNDRHDIVGAHIAQLDRGGLRFELSFAKT